MFDSLEVFDRSKYYPHVGRKYRRLMMSVWVRYFELLKKPEHTEDDKYFIRQVRNYVKYVDYR